MDYPGAREALLNGKIFWLEQSPSMDISVTIERWKQYWFILIKQSAAFRCFSKQADLHWDFSWSRWMFDTSDREPIGVYHDAGIVWRILAHFNVDIIMFKWCAHFLCKRHSLIRWTRCGSQVIQQQRIPFTLQKHENNLTKKRTPNMKQTLLLEKAGEMYGM